jgi:hypothetical protein
LSTNSTINEYQFNVLPVPVIVDSDGSITWEPLFEAGRWRELGEYLKALCSKPGELPQPVTQALIAMSQRIQEIEANRVLKSRSERSHLALENQPIQDAIDAVLFRCYGLSDDDAKYIEQRLQEML